MESGDVVVLSVVGLCVVIKKDFLLVRSEAGL